MMIKTYARSVIGASHIRKGTPCEDASWYDDTHMIKDAYVLAVADGHGSTECKYSADGAREAVKTFYTIIQKMMDKMDFSDGWSKFAPKTGEDITFAKTVVDQWQKKVAHVHRKNKRPDNPQKKKVSSRKLAFRKAEQKDDWYWNIDYMLYGTTLLGIAVIGTDVLVYQIGDGDMMYINRNGVRNLVDGDHFLGVETYSLAHENAWNYVKTAVISIPELEKGPGLIMLSTDGLANSYANEIEFKRTCKDYFDIIEEDGFDTVCKEIGDDKAGWLRDTSDGGCGDDISLALAYFIPDTESKHMVQEADNKIKTDNRNKMSDEFKLLVAPVVGKGERIL